MEQPLNDEMTAPEIEFETGAPKFRFEPNALSEMWNHRYALDDVKCCLRQWWRSPKHIVGAQRLQSPEAPLTVHLEYDPMFTPAIRVFYVGPSI